MSATELASAKLTRLLGGEDLAWLRHRVRQALEAGTGPQAVTLHAPTSVQRQAVAVLFGRRLPTGRTLTVRLADLEAVLQRSGTAPDLATAITLLGGPLTDRRGVRDAAARDREQPYVAARAWASGSDQVGWLEQWLTGVRRSGLLTRVPAVADASALVLQALLVLTKLPVDVPVGRNELAAQMCADAHALDDGTTCGALVLRGLAVRDGRPLPTRTGERRELWERFGVRADTVSATCLTLGVRPLAGARVAARLRAAADSGDPLHLTAWDLAREPLTLAPGTTVLVCENPRVLEAVAGRRGGDLAVVCSAGSPNLVVMSVLTQLAEAGAVLRYHGDFDWPGIAIANRLTTTGCVPWRMTAADYLAAKRVGGLPLHGTPVMPSWDAALGAAMRREGTAVHEEAVLDTLLAWL